MRVVQLDAQQVEQVFPLFRQVFGTDIASALVEWKYGAGRGVQYGVLTDDGRLVAHCGLMYRDALVQGRLVRVGHFGDNMALPEKPGGLARRGAAFGLLFARMLEDLPGPRNPDALTYGFPSAVAARLLERLRLAFTLDTFHELVFAAQPPRRRRLLDAKLEAVQDFGPGFRQRADRLWRQMAHDFEDGVVGVRDAAYLEFRYLHHPQLRYEVYGVKTAVRRTIGLLVCKRTGAELELMDVVGSLDNIGRCLRVLKASLHELGATAARMWLPSRYAQLFAPLAAEVLTLQFPLLVNHNSSGGRLERFKDRWWLTSGDTDYH